MADMQAITRTKTVEPFSSITPAPYVDLSAGMQQGISRGLGELQQITDGIMEQSGRQDGMNAGLERDADGNPTMKMLAPIGAYGRAFNAGAEAAYTSNLASDAEKSIEGFKEQYQDKENGTALYAASWKTYKDKTLNAVAPELRGFAEMKLNAVGAAGLNSVSQYQYQRTREMQGKSIVESMNQDGSKLLNLALTGGVTSPQFKLAMDEWAHKREALVQGRFINPEMASAYDKKLNDQVQQGVVVHSFVEQFNNEVKAGGASGPAKAAQNLTARIKEWMENPANANSIPAEERKAFFSSAAGVSYQLATNVIQTIHQQKFDEQVAGRKVLASLYSRMDDENVRKNPAALAQLSIEASSAMTKYSELSAAFYSASREARGAIASFDKGMANMKAYWARNGMEFGDSNTQNLDNIYPPDIRTPEARAKWLKDNNYQGSVDGFDAAVLAQPDQASQIQLVNNELNMAKQQNSARERAVKVHDAMINIQWSKGQLPPEYKEEAFARHAADGYSIESFVKTYKQLPQAGSMVLSSRNPENFQTAMNIIREAKNSGGQVKLNDNDVQLWTEEFPNARRAGVPDEKAMQTAIEKISRGNERFEKLKNDPEVRSKIDVDREVKKAADIFTRISMVNPFGLGTEPSKDLEASGDFSDISVGHGGFREKFKDRYIYHLSQNAGADEAGRRAAQDMKEDGWASSKYARFRADPGETTGILTGGHVSVVVRDGAETSKAYAGGQDEGLKDAVFTFLMSQSARARNPNETNMQAPKRDGRLDRFDRETLFNEVYGNDMSNISIVSDQDSVRSGTKKFNITLRHPDGTVETLPERMPDYDPAKQQSPWRHPDDPKRQMSLAELRNEDVRGKMAWLLPGTQQRMSRSNFYKLDGGE